MGAEGGRLLYLAGNDGTGKTTQARLLLERLAAEGITAQYVWLRFPQLVSLPVLALSRLLGVTRYQTIGGRRTGRWEFHRAPWLAWLLLWTQVLDAWIARARLIDPSLARSEAVVVDRYVYDIAVDIATAARDPGLLRCRPARLLYRLVRAADVILLDAPSAALRSRRADLAVDDDLEIRSEFYRLLARELGVRRVDATRPPDEVLRSVVAGTAA